MRIPNGLLAIALAGTALAARAADDDETWLLRQMAAPSAPGIPVAAERATTVAFADLARMGGRRVTVENKEGVRTPGVVERADADTVVLRVLRSSGWVSLTLARADLRAIRGG